MKECHEDVKFVVFGAGNRSNIIIGFKPNSSVEVYQGLGQIPPS